MPKSELQPDDFHVEAETHELKSNKGKTLATTKDEPVAQEIADRLNEQASRRTRPLVRLTRS